MAERVLGGEQLLLVEAVPVRVAGDREQRAAAQPELPRDDEERGGGAGRSTTFGSVVCASSRNSAVGKSVEGTCSGTQ